jgi:hypothetical protein
MDKNLAGVIAELMPKPPREGVRPPRADVVVEGITTTQTQVCVLVRIVVP